MKINSNFCRYIKAATEPPVASTFSRSAKPAKLAGTTALFFLGSLVVLGLCIATPAYSDEPLPAVEKSFCVADPEMTSSPDSGTGITAKFDLAEINTNLVPDIAGTLRARAEGGAQSRTARVFAGYRLTPEISFPATFTNELRVTGYLRDAANPPARVRVNMRIIDVETGEVLASADPQPFAEENPPNSDSGITESFTDASVEISIYGVRIYGV